MTNFCPNCGTQLNIDAKFYQKDNSVDVQQSNNVKKSFKLIFTNIMITLLFIGIKMFSFGWVTFILIFTFIHPAMLIIYNFIGISFAKKKEKTKKDYLRYILLSSTILLHSIVFVDVADTEGCYGPLIFIMPEELLFKLTCITGILFFILSIEFFCHIYKYNKQKKDMLVSKMTIFCPNCGIKFNKEQTDWVYDKNNIHVVAFVLSALGLFLGVFLTIPGLILSILSLQKINKGELPSKNKGLTISGIILSSLRIIITIYRIVQLTYIWN